MRLIDADALKAEWYRLNDINEEDCGARFVGYQEIARLINNAPTVEPTGDYISRADAIEAVHEYYQKRFTEDSKWNADAKMFILEDKTIAKDNMEICNIINALPSADSVSDAYKRGFEDCKRAYEIELARSADAVQGWIPVEEQPPQFPCLICDANGNQPSVPLGIVTITDEEHGEWHIDGRLWDSPKVFVDGEWGNQISYGNRITAWMSLPKPYKGGDEE